MRIVSLLPSATEIVHALGHGPDLVGRSAECDFPPEVARLPVVMRARVEDRSSGSAEIDARVRAARGRAESLYTLDLPLLTSLRPDLLLTQDLCGVCSVTGEEVERACRAAGIHPRILSLSPTTLGGILDSIRQIGAAVGAEHSARGLVTDLEARQRSVRDHPHVRGKRAVVLEWIDPPILPGLWAPEMLRIAGSAPVSGPAPGAPGRTTSYPALAETAPDLLVISPCSFPVERTLRELSLPRLQRALGSIPGATIWVADEAYFSRPGPRLWHGLELLADLLDGREPRTPMPRERYRDPISRVAA